MYARLLRLHINKENTVLFPLAERMLSDQEQEMIAAEFERIEEEETGAGVHQRYHELAHTLATPPVDRDDVVQVALGHPARRKLRPPVGVMAQLVD